MLSTISTWIYRVDGDGSLSSGPWTSTDTFVKFTSTSRGLRKTRSTQKVSLKRYR
jgi:hypothetical protein